MVNRPIFATADERYTWINQVYDHRAEPGQPGAEPGIRLPVDPADTGDLNQTIQGL